MPPTMSMATYSSLKVHMVQEHIKQKLGLTDKEEVRLFIDGQRLRSAGDALGVLLGNRGDRVDIHYEVCSSPEVEMNTGSWKGIEMNRSGMGLYRREQEARRMAWGAIQEQAGDLGQADFRKWIEGYELSLIHI